MEGNPISYLDQFGLSIWDDDTVHDIISAVQIIFQAAALIALLQGNLLMHNVFKYLSATSLGASLTNLVFDIMDIYYAVNLKKKEEAKERFGRDVFNLIMGVVFTVIGGSSGFGTGISDEGIYQLNTVSNDVMEKVWE